MLTVLIITMLLLLSSLPWCNSTKDNTCRYVSSWGCQGNQENYGGTKDGAGTHKPWCSVGTSAFSRHYNEDCTGCRRDRALKTSSSGKPTKSLYGGALKVGSLYSDGNLGSLYSSGKKKKN